MFSCKSIEELKAREGHFQRLNKDSVVNIRVEGRTEKEYSKYYHDTHKEQDKQWKLNNPDRVKEINNKSKLKNIEKVKEGLKQWRQNNKYLVECECGFSYKKLDEARHRKTQEHLEFLNPELKKERLNRIKLQKGETKKRMLEKRKIQIKCLCGGHYGCHKKSTNEKEILNEKKRLYYEENKETISQRKKEYSKLHKTHLYSIQVEKRKIKEHCICGSTTYAKCRRGEHFKTKQHTNFMEQHNMWFKNATNEFKQNCDDIETLLSQINSFIR